MWRHAKQASIVIAATGIAAAEPEPMYRLLEDLSYRPSAEAGSYAAERCRLDVYHPEAGGGFDTIVWFHGGGLTGGRGELPEGLREKGVAVVVPEYRLHPKVKAPVYIEDAAAAVAWTLEHIGEYGGSRERVFVAGHSAGGYLALMAGLDERWLEAEGADADDLAGVISFSGHTITHFTIRAERGIAGERPVVDEFAPLFHARADAPPVLLISGDRERELLGRYEETAYFLRMMEVNGHKETRLLELDGYDHGGMVTPGLPLMLDFLAATPGQAE